MNISKLAAVARREYVETVKTKAFLFGILLMPVIIVGMIFLSAKMATSNARAEGLIPVAIVDHTGRVAPEMVQLVDRSERTGGWQHVDLEPVQPAATPGEDLERLKQRVRRGTLFGVVEIPSGAIQDDAACVLYLRGPGKDGRSQEIRQLVREAVKRVRFADAGLDASQVAELSRPVPIQQQEIHQPGEHPSEEMGDVMTPFVFAFLMFMGVLGVGQGLLTSVIEEKSSRVVEVLLSALSPLELMGGKILGMAGVGLTMVVLWCGAGYAAATWKHVQNLVQIGHLGEFILYYALGYLLISSIMAAVGSACNTLKEAQPMMMPLTLLIVVPMMFWPQIVDQPNSPLSTALTFVPPMTPFVMILRITSPQGGVPIWQQIFAPIWLGGWMLATVWAAARVFRVGLLMYGKPPGLGELARWVLYR